MEAVNCEVPAAVCPVTSDIVVAPLPHEARSRAMSSGGGALWTGHGRMVAGCSGDGRDTHVCEACVIVCVCVEN